MKIILIPIAVIMWMFIAGVAGFAGLLTYDVVTTAQKQEKIRKEKAIKKIVHYYIPRCKQDRSFNKTFCDGLAEDGYLD